jgi:hypothetical protein
MAVDDSGVEVGGAVPPRVQDVIDAVADPVLSAHGLAARTEIALRVVGARSPQP